LNASQFGAAAWVRVATENVAAKRKDTFAAAQVRGVFIDRNVYSETEATGTLVPVQRDKFMAGATNTSPQRSDANTMRAFV
jgi:hypothetical protein